MKDTFFSKLKGRREAKLKEKENEKPKEPVEPKEIEPPKELDPERKKGGLTSRLDHIEESLDIITQKGKGKKIKKKDFKLPFNVKGQLKKLAVKNKVQVMLLQRNKNIRPTIGELKDGFLIIGDKIHNGDTDFIWLWNGKIPTVIVPEWDLNPLSASELSGNAIEKNRLSDPQTIIIRAMEFKESLGPKKMSSKAIIYIGIGVVIVGYALFANS